jgi:pantoate kinase
MKYDAAIVRGATALVSPLAFLFSLSLLATRPPGEGAGVFAGLAFAMALLLHALVFGAGASRRAFPAQVARLSLALGVVLACAGAGFVAIPFAGQILECGLFLAMIGAAHLVMTVLIGRAPTMLDEDW